MKVLVVISLVVNDPDDLPIILEHLDPPNIPFFDQELRVVVGSDVDDTIKFLDVG